jgi:hypothetical protein
MVRKRSERLGTSFNHAINSHFNLHINDLQLLELPLSDRKFTWAKFIFSDSFALLDRFLCSHS